MSDPDDFYNKEKGYYDKQAARAETAGRVIFVLFMVLAGSVIGWVLRGTVG